MKKIELEKIKLHFRKDGIVEIRLKDMQEITLEDAKEQFHLIDKELPGQQVCMLIIPGVHNTMDVEVKEYANSPECVAKSKAEAFVIDNLAMRITYNFLRKFSKKNMKLFDSEPKATEWLLSQQN